MVVKIKKSKVEIDNEVFKSLLDLPHIHELQIYKQAVIANAITFNDLKALSNKAGALYPLFFSSKEIAQKQIDNRTKELLSKIPSKNELQVTSRGKIELKDVELILNDLGRKQEFLKRRILLNATDNNFVGFQAKQLKTNVPYNNIADNIRTFLNIDLQIIRSHPKSKVLSYLTACAEAKGILVSYSSFNYMPQNIAPESLISGICIKDRKFPFIFINTRDGDATPRILESEGRQIFTLLSMLSCVAVGKFILATRTGQSSSDPLKTISSIAGEIIVPKDDLAYVTVETLHNLKESAHYFRVTPSMLLYRLKEEGRITEMFANELRLKLNSELKKVLPKKIRAPHPVTAYSKYNGQRFSKEVMVAYKLGNISQVEVKNILFRRGSKIDNNVFNEYIKRFG